MILHWYGTLNISWRSPLGLIFFSFSFQWLLFRQADFQYCDQSFVLYRYHYILGSFFLFLFFFFEKYHYL
jgi:hypothetical protein